MTAGLVQTDTAGFASAVIVASDRHPVLVDFWATWCAPCLALAPVLEHLARDLAGRLTVAKVDVDREPQLAAQYGIRSLPTLKLFRHGVVVEEVVGMQSPALLRALVERHLARPIDALIERARVALAAGDAVQAVALLREAQQLEPEHAPLKLELATALLEAKDIAGAEAVVRELPANIAEDAVSRALRSRIEFARAAEHAPALPALERRVSADPDDLEARYLLGVRHILEGNHDPGLAQLLEVMRRDRGFREDLGRRSLLAAFEIVGSDSEAAKRSRAQMARLLY